MGILACQGRNLTKGSIWCKLYVGLENTRFRGFYLKRMENRDIGIIGNIAKRPISFAVTFVIFFVFVLSFLSFTDTLPNKVAASSSHVASVAKVIKTGGAEDPIEIKIAKLGLDVHINNPTSTNVDVLDAALLNGAARYPTSAKLNQTGTVLLFGHSSYLPVVHNQTYKAFKGIQTLPKGEIISVYSATTEYRYSVTSVRVANADEDMVELRQDGTYLTLVTCDSFATKSSRFVVEAKFVGAYPLTSN